MAVGGFILKNRHSFGSALRFARLFLVVAMLAVGLMEMFSLMTQPGFQIGIATVAGAIVALVAKSIHLV